MTSLSDARVLGGIGSIFVLLAVIPSVGWLLGIAGFVVILIAINNISKVINDKKIFGNMLTAVILGIGALVVGAITAIGTVYHLFGMGSFVGSRFVFAPSIASGAWLGLAVPIIVGVFAVWALFVVAAIFIRRSYDSIGARLNVARFKTAGLLFLIGAATAIVGVGLVLIFVAEILLVVSFFSVQDQTTNISQSPQVQTVAPTS
jgi:uncharacterized membrane protein